MTIITRSLSILFVTLAALTPVAAQEFPWADFERRTLRELVKINQEEDGEDLERHPEKGQFVFRGKILPSVVRVIFTGESRSINPERKKFIGLWSGTYSNVPDFGKFFEKEFLFKEEGDEYWLPVAKQIIPYFARELAVGGPVDLYLIRPGGLRSKDKAEWIFMVEEFQKIRQ